MSDDNDITLDIVNTPDNDLASYTDAIVGYANANSSSNGNSINGATATFEGVDDNNLAGLKVVGDNINNIDVSDNGALDNAFNIIDNEDITIDNNDVGDEEVGNNDDNNNVGDEDEVGNDDEKIPQEFHASVHPKMHA